MIKVHDDRVKNPDQTGGSWPTHHQELLLGAALQTKEPALAAWQQWRTEIDIEVEYLDAGSYRLLPLVYHNLHQYHIDDALMDQLKALYRRVWLKNQLQLRTCAQVLQAFHTSGIATLVLKGAALVHLYYPNLAVRPMLDLDILVPRVQVMRAFEILDQLGWQPIMRDRDKLTEDYISMRHAQGFAARNNCQLDLHWHTLADFLDVAVDSQFWQHAVPFELDGVPTHALSPSDQLLHICVHGAAWSPIPPVRWVADAMMILRRPDIEIEWKRLVMMAQRCHSSLHMHATLTYLAEKCAADIPPEVCHTLMHVPVTKQERRLFQVRIRRSTLFGLLPVLWRRYQHQMTQDEPISLIKQCLGFYQYLQTYIGNDNLGAMLTWGGTRTIKRIAIRLFQKSPF